MRSNGIVVSNTNPIEANGNMEPLSLESDPNVGDPRTPPSLMAVSEKRKLGLANSLGPSWVRTGPDFWVCG